MSLQNWLQSGRLTSHQPTVAEITNLLGIADRELADAGVAGLSDDGRFTHAYEGALLLCKLALHASGYALPKRAQGHHALWINSLEFTLGPSHKPVMIHLSACSKLRHVTLYDQTGAVRKEDADDLLTVARQLRAELLAWLHSQNSKLAPPGL